jgi:hypothetical protein
MMPSPIKAQRIERRYRQTIEALPTKVFPLLCPERECDWLPGWRYRMIQSLSGLAEPGAIFATPHDAGSETIWIVTAHRPCEQIGFIRFQPDGQLVEIDITLQPAGDAGCFVDILYRHTALDERGEEALTALTETQWQASMTRWQDAMNAWFQRP